MRKLNKMKKKRLIDLIFCILALSFPIAQFLLFYVGVNANSIILAFQTYKIDSTTNLGSYVYNGFENFKTMYVQITNEPTIRYAFKNSFILFFFSILVGTTLSLVFSAYITKKMPMSKVFRVLLFAPSILSSIVTVTMFRFFAEGAIPAILKTETGLLSNPKTTFGTLIFYNLWISFGTQILMYSGAIDGIDKSIFEAAKLDGASSFREFISIIIPLIFPTITTFLITGIAGIFVSQMNLFSFYGSGAKAQDITIGYYLFKNTERATLGEYPLLATYGVVLTLVTAPLVFLSRKLMNRLDWTR